MGMNANPSAAERRQFVFVNAVSCIEGRLTFSRIEAVYAGEDDGERLEKHVEYCIRKGQIETATQNNRFEKEHP